MWINELIMTISERDVMKLESLNQDVESVIKKRESWLDEKMIKYSDLQVGDDIYDIESGVKIGVVTKLYRYWTSKNQLLDSHFEFNYEYNTGNNCFSNTRGSPSIHYGTKSQAFKRAKDRLDDLNDYEYEIPD